ncbi:MAG TPA: ATP-binding cassette domain-containing protein [Candidatus Thermoplasmatota archaeon]|nr:ATP-binding cassette domain-containing protein [Candidatus Thermoplasmatota archaeon]
MAVISLRGLTRKFGNLTAVDKVDLDIARGEIFGLLGPNGAGKTTTIKMLITLLAPTAGTAVVDGHDVVEAPALVRRKVGIVFQEPSLDSILTARENLELHGRLYGVPRARLGSRVDEMLALVDLTKRANDLTKTYSGGMKRRLELARGLLHQPPVLFLDEPTLGLDPATREHIWAYIERLRRERGTTVVLTTHYMHEADRLCDRVGIIDHGKIVALDTPARLKASLGGEVVVLAQKVPDAGVFRGLEFVDKAEVVGRETRLSVKDAARNLPRILQLSGELENVQIRTPTLEDVFIKLTGRDMRDEAASGGGWMEDYSRMQQGENR